MDENKRYARMTPSVALFLSALALVIGATLYAVSPTTDASTVTDGDHSNYANNEQIPVVFVNLKDQLGLGVIIPDSPTWNALISMVLNPSFSWDASTNTSLLSMEHLRQKYVVNYLSYYWPIPIWRNSSSSECDWTGITCNEQGFITELQFSSSWQLSGTLPTELTLLSYLETFSAPKQAQLSGSLASLYPLTNLRHLDLDSTRFTSLTSGIGNWTNLESFIFTGTPTDAIIPSELATLKSLKKLQLNDNTNLEGNIGEMIPFWEKLEYFDISRSRLHGSIPTEIGYLTSLSTFKTSFSPFYGTLPSEIDRCTAMSELLLEEPTALDYMSYGGNVKGLSGSADALNSLSTMSNLRWLSLAGNTELKATIPTTIGDLSNLIGLNIVNSGVTGTLPEELSQLSNTLTIMNLELSKLSGTVPLSYQYLTKLTYVTLAKTRLQGAVPFCLSATPPQYLTATCISGNGQTSSDYPVMRCDCCSVCTSL